ncbi:MAG: aspartate aminotransferase family protein [Actinomycetota bacterium]
MDVERLNAKAREIAGSETEKLLASTSKSAALYERAHKVLPYGVPSTFQANDPYPIYLSHGKGPKVWDVDGTERLDFHNGFGSMAVGHAHPKIVEAIEKQAKLGTHFAAPTEVTVEYAEALAERFNCDMVRLTQSGTEATADAIRVARAYTGKYTILKIEGSYHGHHDAVMFSVVPNSDMMGGRDLPASTPMSKGIPPEMAERVKVVPFNDLEATKKMLDEFGDEIGCMILEPVMMNIGIVVPEPGYLQGLKDLCEAAGVVLIFDEVKCGATIAHGGAAERFGTQPHLSAWAKSIGGGLVSGAFGGQREIMDTIEHGAAQIGTYNGNPLTCAGGVAALREVLTKDAYEHMGKLGTMLAEGCQRALDEAGIPGHTVDLGCKGCVSYRAEPLRNYRDFLETNTEIYYASFPWMVNRGIFMTPGDEEQWTLSVQHSESDIRTYVEAFGEFCSELSS